MVDEEREERFRRLFESARPHVLAYALRRSADAEDAADVVAETFAIGWRKLDGVPDGEAALLWFYATARRVLANQTRRVRRRTDLVERMGAELGAALARGHDAEPVRMAAVEALRRLADADRELLMLAGWEGLDTAQLARVLGCSATAVRIRMHRARSRLATEMVALGIDTKHPAASGQSPPRSAAQERAAERA